ncbi:MAG: hypothetical protein WC967_12565 [Balneolaceae bacterium]
MNKIPYSVMEKEIGFGWEFAGVGEREIVDRNGVSCVVIYNDGVNIHFVSNFDRKNDRVREFKLTNIAYVRRPGENKWLKVVESPEIGSVWKIREIYLVVTSVSNEIVYYTCFKNREMYDNSWPISEWFENDIERVFSDHIIEGMGGGRRRRFVKTGEVRIVEKQEKDVWYMESDGRPTGWMGDADSLYPVEILIPLDFVIDSNNMEHRGFSHPIRGCTCESCLMCKATKKAKNFI